MAPTNTRVLLWWTGLKTLSSSTLSSWYRTNLTNLHLSHKEEDSLVHLLVSRSHSSRCRLNLRDKQGLHTNQHKSPSPDLIFLILSAVLTRLCLKLSWKTWLKRNRAKQLEIWLVVSQKLKPFKDSSTNILKKLKSCQKEISIWKLNLSKSSNSMKKRQQSLPPWKDVLLILRARNKHRVFPRRWSSTFWIRK